jgi:dTDP-4-amino-4,6-dideoxygalactose transaminase
MKKIPIAKPFLGEEEALATHRPILSGWVTQGPEVAAFEQEFAEFVGSTHAAAVANCTVAIYMALLAVGVEPGSEVITVSHSFIATANAVRYTGAKPVFVDIDPATYNMDPALIEAVVNERTSAILCVHQLGMPCDLSAVIAIAQKHGLPVVEDAACATGSEIKWNGKWEKIGKPHGDIACFSFHPRKVITTGDGGMLTTNNPEYDQQFRLLRQHGMSVSDAARHGSNQVINESYVMLGHNFRMTDIQAAVGREQLKRLPVLLEERRALAENYHNLLQTIQGVVCPSQPEFARSNWQSYCIRLPEEVSQQQVMQYMLDQGISTRRGVMCAHREPAYPRGTWSCGVDQDVCGCVPFTCARLHESEAVQDHGLVIPLYNGLAREDQQVVGRTLQDAIDASKQA